MDATQAAAPDSLNNETEVIKKMEDEHLRLQRQARMTQIDRQHRTMGVHPQFRRQDQLLMTLKKEYINLVKDLKIARSGAHKKKAKKMKYDLQRALLLRVKSEIDCEGGLTIMQQLEGLQQRNNKDMLFLRKLANATKGQLEERRGQSEYRLVSTENKLEAAMLRFNDVQCENKKIREEIEHMLKDRALFNQAWSKMMIALNKGKKFLTDLFESSTLAYDQRDDWCTKLRSVQEKGKMDQMQQVQEMRELKKAYDHETKLYNFLATKGIKRINRKQQLRDEEQKRKDEEDSREQLNIHLMIMEEINEYTDESSINKIIESFTKKEQENFSIYNLVTEYCAENKVLSHDVRRIQQDAVDRKEWNEMMEVKRGSKLESLRLQVQKQKQRSDKLRSKLEDQEKITKETMEKVQEIFKMLDCSLDPFQNLLGDKEPSLHHLDLSLRLITDKIKEHIQEVYYYERCIQKKSEKASTSRLKKYTIHAEPPGRFTPIPINLFVPADPCPACVETRWLSRVCDVPEVPLDGTMCGRALAELVADPAYERGDRVHTLAECRVPASRVILARRYMQ